MLLAYLTSVTYHRRYLELLLAHSPDGAFIASSSLSQIKIWDTTTGEEVRTLGEHIDDIYALAYSPDGKFIASGSRNQIIKIWDIIPFPTIYVINCRGRMESKPLPICRRQTS